MTTASTFLVPFGAFPQLPVTHALVAILLCVAAAIDWRTMRLPNWLTAGGMVAGLLVNAFWPAPGVNVWWALAGLAGGMACTLPFYAMRVMGAGDVKLVGAVGAFLGAPAVIGALLYTFIAGGIAAILFALWRRSFKRLAGNVGDASRGLLAMALAGERGSAFLPAGASVGKLPYGLAICAGTLAWLAFPTLL